jgi:hypothetical protein
MQEEIFDVVNYWLQCFWNDGSHKRRVAWFKNYNFGEKVATWQKAFNYRKSQRESYKQRSNKKVCRLFS